MITSDPPPTDASESAFEVFSNFLRYSQSAIDVRTLGLGKPLKDATEEEFDNLVASLRNYTEFEIDHLGDRLQDGLPIAVSGRGLVLMRDRKHAPVGSHLMEPGDMLLGTLSSVDIQPVATYESYVRFITDQIDKSQIDPIISVVPLLTEAKLYRISGAEIQNHDLSGYIVGPICAHRGLTVSSPI